MIEAVLLFTCLSLLITVLLRTAQRSFVTHDSPLVEQVNALLPQTQCGQCAYPGCRPYAQAIVLDHAPINRCPPGGQATIAKLADLLNREIIDLDPTHGTETAPTLVMIRESECIGCTLCIQACPVDAIVGAPKMLHTVLADRCTGCNLCIPPCPVDCIDIIPKPQTSQHREKPHGLV